MKFINKHLEALISIACIFTTGIFWIATMNGIPQRVTKLETEVDIIKNQLSKNDIKTDIILEDIKFIKQFVIDRHSK